jgi:photosystem II stability/assembly factor-like uncharacterized protein
MKTMIKCVATFSLVSQFVLGQWENILPNEYYTWYDGIFILNKDTAVAVGGDGVIARTTDGGTNWIQIAKGTVPPLHTVWFVNADTGYAAGDGILKSTDGGLTWKKQISWWGLWSMCFINVSTGFAVGYDGVILKTTNGGLNWEAQSRWNSYTLQRIFFLNSKIGFIVGEKLVLKTTDGGKTWSIVYNTSKWPVSVHFPSESTGYVTIMDGTIIKTTNGGKDWQQLSYQNPDRFGDIYFFNDSVGFAASFSEIVKTTNGGSTWEIINCGTRRSFTEIHFLDSKIGYAVGQDCTILNTTDGGTTWKIQSPRISSRSFDVHSLIVSGANLFAGTEDGIFRSSDNGEIWTAVNNGLPKNGNVYYPINSFAILGSKIFVGWGETDQYRGTTIGGVVISTNDGISWTAYDTGLSNTCINTITISESYLFAGTDSGIYRSPINESNWTMTTLDTVSVSSFAVNGNTLYAGTDKGVFLSTNIGATWTYVGLTNIHALIAIPKISGDPIIYAARHLPFMSGDGGEVCRSTNNGASWQITVLDLISSLAFADTIVFAGLAGDGTSNVYSNPILNKGLEGGKILCSIDNGATWNGVDANLTEGVSISSLAIMGNNLFCGAHSSGAPGDGVWRRPLSEMIKTSTWVINPTNGHSYKVIECGTWQQCHNTAIVQSANLVTIRNKAEQDWLISTFGANEWFWIGLTDQVQETNFVWMSREPLTYTNWAEGEPNNFWDGGEHWVVMNWGTGGTWNDLGLNSGEWSSVTRAVIERIGSTNISRDESVNIPSCFDLFQNYPNPFNPTTTIRYALPSSANVKLTIHDILGREITTLVNEEQSAGWKEVEWNGSASSSGIYFYKLEAGGFTEVKKLMLLK